MYKYLIIIIATGLMLFSFFCIDKNKHESTKLKEKKFPNFNLLNADSLTFLSANETKEKNKILLYFSSKCPFCKIELNDILNNSQSLKGTEILLVTFGDFKSFKRFYEDYRIQKYPNVSAGLDIKDSLGNYFKVSEIPFIATFNSDKKQLKTYVGVTKVSKLTTDLAL